MTDPRREAVIEEAKSWLRTPFHHQARVKGHGVDCGQLLIAVYGSLGYMPPDYELAYYPPDFALHRDQEWYLSIVREFAREVDAPGPGDIVLFKMGRLYSHGGIVTAWPQIIHAWSLVPVVLYGDATNYPLADRSQLFFSPFPAEE